MVHLVNWIRHCPIQKTLGTCIIKKPGKGAHTEKNKKEKKNWKIKLTLTFLKKITFKLCTFKHNFPLSIIILLHTVYSNTLGVRGKISIFWSDTQVWPLLCYTSLNFQRKKILWRDNLQKFLMQETDLLSFTV